MKNIIKNIVAVLVLSGLLFVPFLSSAQTSRGIYNESNNSLRSPINNEISQAEFEAIEEMQILEAKPRPRRLFLKRNKKMKNRIFVSDSNLGNNDKSQAEMEAEQELQYIHIISTFRNLNSIDPVQASSQQFSLISDLMALNYDEEMSLIQNIR